MGKFDDIVVGSGIGGMTLALLLAETGRSVLLVEKSRAIGGSMLRFYRDGVPFDTGFHFTGGFVGQSLLRDMLQLVGIDEMIRPVFVGGSKGSSRILIESHDREFDLPTGCAAAADALKGYFPGEHGAIDAYFATAQRVCDRTAGMSLRQPAAFPVLLPEDQISLDEGLGRLTSDAALKAVLSIYAMTYGTRPSEISFANHCRVAQGMHESVARVENGGDAFVRAFRTRAQGLPIELKRATTIVECADVQNRTVGRFVLSDGEEVAADHCTFTIHPYDILKTLPREHIKKAFVNRVTDFEPTIGMFAVYGVLDSPEPVSPSEAFGPSILSLLPTPDVDAMFDPHREGDQALVVMRSIETAGSRSHRVVNVLEISFTEHIRQWLHCRAGERDESYLEYKERHVERIKERLFAVYPEYRGSYRVVKAASPLTFREFLNSPDGSAYGVKQKIGQHSLFGRLPFRNLFAAGQSAMLPGVIGSMAASVVVGRGIIGNDAYVRLLGERLGI
ncbi:MAG: NAD(P)/FAD-dependent oxidoreductase [Deltaproteobacteria bacterium]|nr:NAD(P)/FAD-dependent oxidoreductase [Deltaproteobacteria bacterium]MBM4268544.1 NAD(P)/FAD-dependent oxidoreductase [Deltaproteobacteria bacterium]